MSVGKKLPPIFLSGEGCLRYSPKVPRLTQQTPHNKTARESRLVEFPPMSIHCSLLSLILLCHKFCCKIIFFFYLPQILHIWTKFPEFCIDSLLLKISKKDPMNLFRKYKWLQFSFHRHIYKMLVSSQLSHLCLWTTELFPFLHFLQNHFHEWYS